LTYDRTTVPEFAYIRVVARQTTPRLCSYLASAPASAAAQGNKPPRLVVLMLKDAQ
jgi:hypothetical protein